MASPQRWTKTNLGLAALALAAFESALIAWLWLGHPPEWFRVFFYNIVWWPHLALVETAAQLLTGRSLLYQNPRGFVWLCLASTPFWTSFEILNAVIHNWIYVGIPQNQFVRWAGYAISYASVLPAIRVYMDLLNAVEPSPKNQASKPQRPRFLTPFSFAVGVIQFTLCVAHPGLFYPLAWSFPFFLTEPLVIAYAPERSYLLSWLNGRLNLTLKTLVAGFLAGITWEFLNWKSAAKWIYTIPSEAVIFKIFEMPVLGYIGFAAFALCAESFSNLVLSPEFARRPGVRRLSFAAGAIASALGFALIDLYIWKR
ncbi:MAG: hypothetical protein HYT79_08020 [Elusimicrobia bacterium]|nr:hypothetical protein [Elusimicrobiota bacterium]